MLLQHFSIDAQMLENFTRLNLKWMQLKVLLKRRRKHHELIEKSTITFNTDLFTVVVRRCILIGERLHLNDVVLLHDLDAAVSMLVGVSKTTVAIWNFRGRLEWILELVDGNIIVLFGVALDGLYRFERG